MMYMFIVALLMSSVVFIAFDEFGPESDAEYDEAEEEQENQEIDFQASVLGEAVKTLEEVLVLEEPDGDSVQWSGDLQQSSTGAIIAGYENTLGDVVETRDDYIAARAAAASGEYDVISGTPEDDHVFSGNGRDILIGWEGNDTLSLGDGDDTIQPVFDREMIGHDSLRGGDGDDWLEDRFGRDILRGDSGDDTLIALDQSPVRGADFVGGGRGDDVLSGDSGDTIKGGDGADFISIYVPGGPGVARVIVEDFDATEDTVRILVETDAPQYDEAFEVDKRMSGDDVRVFVNDQEVAIFQNLSIDALDALTIGNYRATW